MKSLMNFKDPIEIPDDFFLLQVWRGLGVSASRLDKPLVEALFLKYGVDTTGRLPYDMFVSRLLETHARRRAQELRQVGPYVLGGDYRCERRGLLQGIGWG